MSLANLIRQVRALTPGTQVSFDRHVIILAEAQDLRLSMQGFSVPDRVLESIVGSSYEYGYSHDPLTERVTFFRRRTPLTDGSRTYVSPDRLRFFTKRIDGTYVLKETGA